MSQKQTKHGSPGTRAPRGGGGRKSEESQANNKEKSETNAKYNENVVRKLYECFQDIFDYDLVASVCHTCQWDAAKATEALMVLGDAAYVNRRKNSKGNKGDVNKNKPKSLPSTLKPSKSDSDKGSNSLYAMPNSLRNNPAHVSTSSLSSGQVWQRHYKSKPQSPGLLTMIPPYSKEGSKLKKSGSARSLPAQPVPPPPPQPKPKESPEVKKASDIVRRIQTLVQNGVKVLILMRGVPGSGKTHLAQVVVNLVTKGGELSQHIFSTDDYFILLGRGNYAYDSHQLPLAHNWNQRRVFEALRRATNPVVVDNTHTQAWEMEPYVSMAVSQGYLIEVLEPVTPWRTKEAELAKRNIHSVPREKIRQMLERYERGWTGEKLIQLFGLNYVPCGSAHVSQELTTYNTATTYNNSPLAQHRQHSVIDTPEKPKRKKSSPKKKDRRHLAGIEITEDKEKQLEELNQLFAEYGKKMDPLSKKKVLESGVPISEVVSRMRKLQGNILPLPKVNVYPPTIPEKDGSKISGQDGVVEPVPNYPTIPRESPCESVEPDTMSSSNASETSECETDEEASAPNPAGTKGLFNYKCAGEFIDNEDMWEDFEDDKIKKAMGIGCCKAHSAITSSQEELSIIDFECSTNPACSSQDELSLLDFDDGDDKDGKDGSSSSSEEQETQLLTLQESLREVLIDSYEKRKHLEQRPEADANTSPEKNDLIKNAELSAADGQPTTSESFVNAVSKRLGNMQINDNCFEETLLKTVDSMLRDLRAEKTAEGRTDAPGSNIPNKRSPDLEEIPLPSIPPGTEDVAPAVQSGAKIATKRETMDEIMSSWENPPEKDKKPELPPKPERPKSGLLGAIKKTGIQRDQSPEELLRSIELSWSSIPFTSSWEDVDKKPSEKKEMIQRSRPQRKPVNKKDTSTNTKHSDFDLWKDGDMSVVTLIPQNRNINHNLVVDPAASNYATEYPMLDKGSMTSDLEEFSNVSMDSSLEMLSGMFPDIKTENLADVLEKCKGDIHWAVELLLDSPHNVEIPEIPTEVTASEENTAEAAQPESGSVPIETLNISDGKKTIKRRKDRKSAPSELSLMLKKQIEDGIHINEECYQDKTLFLKYLRRGDIQLDYNPQQSVFGDVSKIPEFVPRSYEPIEVCPQQMDYPQEEEDEEEETIPMKIDPEFFQQLAKHFGHCVEPEQIEGPNSVSIVNIPVSVGHQIYSCWLETVNRQVEEMQTIYDNMIKEDELLAKALQEQEQDQHKPDLKKIMDMELAMALYKQDEEQRYGKNQETIASKLTKQLLFEAYPSVDRKMILDLFRSKGYSFDKTVEVLNSQRGDTPKNVVAPEFLEAYENKLIEQAKEESMKKNSESPRKPIIIVKQQATGCKKSGGSVGGSGDSKDILVVNPAEFRQNMSLLQKRRNDCCRQAQEAFRNKSYSVASYYSHIANLYKERIIEINKKSISLKLFDDKRTDISTKLDLHFLFVPEALQVLDQFLDHHIKDLNRKNLASLDLYLITGRGLRNRLKKSKIKPAIKKRLDQRNLAYAEQNPGMLKVTIHKGDCLSDQL